MYLFFSRSVVCAVWKAVCFVGLGLLVGCCFRRAMDPCGMRRCAVHGVDLVCLGLLRFREWSAVLVAGRVLVRHEVWGIRCLGLRAYRVCVVGMS